MEIGILGLTFNSGNKGCEALSYSFLQLLNEVAETNKEKIIVNLLIPLPTRMLIKKRFAVKTIKKMYYPIGNYPLLSFDCLFYIYRNNRIFFLNSIEKCRCVFDYTAGDSFTDMYGKDRFYSRTRCKLAVIEQGIPLILGSQTIGPFSDEKVKKMAIDVINRSAEVYVRDKMSYEYTRQLSGRTPKITSDIAFALPYREPPRTDIVKIGFNPSGLLWSGGYTQDNQFGLTVDYQQYCRTIINILIQRKYEVHLIPHAFTDDKNSKDNDYIAVNVLHKEFPETIVCDGLRTPMEIKSYIAGMNAFIGARMHATIAAFSAGVPVIPFSYSRKFEGLFDSLDYPYVIHGKEYTTDIACKKTLNYIENRQQLQVEMQAGHKKTKESLVYISAELSRILFENDENRV